MSQNKGWFKQYRNSLMQFSTDPNLNNNLFNVFTYLLSNAVWDEFDGLKRGQVRIQIKDIQKDWMPYLDLVRIRHLIRILVKNNYVIIVKSSTHKTDDAILEICNYELFSGCDSQKDLNQCLTSASLVLNQCHIDKQLESLNNNYVELTGLTSASPVLHQCLTTPPCSNYIEERNIELKYISGEQSSPPQIISNDVKLTKVKKEKKPRAPKRQSVTKYHHIVFRVFEPDPRFVKKTWVDKKAIFFAVDEFLEKYGCQGETAILEMYAYFRQNNLCGKNEYSIAMVESVLNDAIKIEMNKELQIK